MLPSPGLRLPLPARGSRMGISNHAMREGTEISLRRFAAEVAEGSFRQ